jgi:hypothetical protein
MHGGTRRLLPVERDGMVSDGALGKTGIFSEMPWSVLA